MNKTETDAQIENKLMVVKGEGLEGWEYKNKKTSWYGQSFFLILAFLMVVYFIVVLICISVMVNHVEHLFICLLHRANVHTFSEVSGQNFCLLLFFVLSSLGILDISPLLDLIFYFQSFKEQTF